MRDDDTFGATKIERVASYTQRKRWFRQLTFVLMLGPYLLVLLIRQEPQWQTYILVTIALLPWCCILLAHYFRREVALGSSRDAEGTPILPILLQSILLTMLASQDVTLVRMGGVILRGAVVGLPLLLAIRTMPVTAHTASRERAVVMVIGAIAAWMYGGSILAMTNAMLDKRSPQVFQTHVVGKYITSGKGGVRHYLELAPWGPESSGSDLRVDDQRYADARTNDPVCMGVYPGRFGLPWMHSVPCPTTAVDPAPP